MSDQHASSQHRRSPIVVVMGHIDHGKTTLLDYFRKTKVAEKETGGITQHIGAYEGEHNGRRITFIDTPGHEAFSKMRSRGAKVADIAILVIAADESIKPQTREAITLIREANIPFIVAINKIDKTEANPERVRQDLTKEEILVEAYGGKTPAVEVSAKSGKGTDDLLEMITLLADIEHLSADPEKPAQGVVLEANRDSRRGVSASLLVRDGTLHKKDFLVIGGSVQIVKIFEDFRGKSIDEAGPSSPVRVVGLQSLPSAGDVFQACADRQTAETLAASVVAPVRKDSPAVIAEGQRVFNVVIKADVRGSQEVLEEAVRSLSSEKLVVEIRRSEVGDISETDVKFAIATGAVTLIGFRVRMDPAVKELAEHSHIRVVQSDIIYDVIEKLKECVRDVIPPEVRRTEVGRAVVLKIFRKEGSRQVVGGLVEEGVVRKGARIGIFHATTSAGEGEIVELQRDRKPAEEVPKGVEFGIMVQAPATIHEGDTLEVFTEEIIPSAL